MGIFHSFVSTADDDPNSLDVPRPIDWDADHYSPAHVLLSWAEHEIAGGQIWANQPAIETRFFDDQRTYRYADLRFATEIRFVVEMLAPGASGSELRAQYSTNGGGSWLTLGGSVSIAASGLIAGAWGVIADLARIENSLIRVTGINGNGVADPKFRSVCLQFR